MMVMGVNVLHNMAKRGTYIEKYVGIKAPVCSGAVGGII